MGLVACCLLPVACCLLPVACCLLPRCQTLVTGDWEKLITNHQSLNTNP
ncbi:MAG: hypothetical protein AB4426_27525 [Xenococcaceae cyanobacterium]